MELFTVYNRLAKRLERIEQVIMPVENDDGKVSIRFAHLHMLPHTYVGEKHEVLVRGYPTEDPYNDCVIQELPGPGPDLEFDFRKDTKRRTILIRFLEADGDGRPKGYLPEEADLGSGVEQAIQAGTGGDRW
jgi:hypothetical protein